MFLTDFDCFVRMESIGSGFGHLLGLAERPGSYQTAGRFPAIFICGCDFVKELSVFIDESGDFGPYEPHSPLYIVALIFHDQSLDISLQLSRLRSTMSQRGLPDYTVHAAPLIRREKEYKYFPIAERKAIFDNLFYFVRKVDITYRAIVIEKKELVEDIDLNIRITKQLSAFLFQHFETFAQYDRIAVYYDYGQKELTNIIVTAFSALLGNVVFHRVVPADYKLFQAADMICTLELLSKKAENKALSKSELDFFTSERNLKRAYLKALWKKRF